jgi:hypothetical protein
VEWDGKDEYGKNWEEVTLDAYYELVKSTAATKRAAYAFVENDAFFKLKAYLELMD